MVYVGRFDTIPDYIREASYYRIELAPDGGYDVHLDEPERPMVAPLGEEAGLDRGWQYQEMLRTLGTLLDELNIAEATIEVSPGQVRVLQASEPWLSQLDSDRLQQESVAQRGWRGQGPHASHAWRLGPGLREVGAALDRRHSPGGTIRAEPRVAHIAFGGAPTVAVARA